MYLFIQHSSYTERNTNLYSHWQVLVLGEMNRAVTLTQCSHCNKQNKSLEPPEGKQLPGEVKVPRSHQILQRLEFYRSPHPHPARLSGVTPGVLTGRRGRGDRGCGERRGAGAGGSSNRLASVRHRRAGVWVCWWCFPSFCFGKSFPLIL